MSESVYGITFVSDEDLGDHPSVVAESTAEVKKAYWAPMVFFMLELDIGGPSRLALG